MRRFGLDNLVDDTVILGFVRGHEEVPVRIGRDLVDGLVGVVGNVLIQEGLGEQNLLGLYLNVGCGSLRPSKGLVDHDSGVGEGLSLPRRPGPQQERPHTGGHAEAHGLNIARNEPTDVTIERQRMYDENKTNHEEELDSESLSKLAAEASTATAVKVLLLSP